jgi:hypothetical protein
MPAKEAATRSTKRRPEASFCRNSSVSSAWATVCAAALATRVAVERVSRKVCALALSRVASVPGRKAQRTARRPSPRKVKVCCSWRAVLVRELKSSRLYASS